MPCLDENTVERLARGTLGAEELVRVHQHLDVCGPCRCLAAEVARDASLPSASCREELSASLESAAPVEAEGPAGPVSRYFVLGTLGQGGMGRVLLAYDAKLDRKVALKRVRVRDARLSPEACARLLREAQAMARLSHPNVLTIHDAGEIDGELSITMEYVEGRTLRHWLKEPRSWREIVTIFCDAGEGLAAAHRAGLIHGDFKPDNVLVGNDGRVRVTDFGLAQVEGPALEGAPVAETPGTDSGALSGTPGYIAPEVPRGAKGSLSDQFSFFVSLSEALYGERPFAGTSLGAQLEAARAGHVRPAPRGRGVPLSVRRQVLIGLTPEPDKRFPSMAAALAALKRTLRRSRRRAQVAVGAAALTVFTWVMLWIPGRPAQQCVGSERHLEGTWDDLTKQRLGAAFVSTGTPQAEATFRATANLLDAWTGTWVNMRTQACVATRVVGEQSTEMMDLKMSCLDRRWMDFEALVRRLSVDGEVPVDNAVRAAANLADLSECANPSSLVSQPDLADSSRARHDELRRQLAEARAHQLVRAVGPGLQLAQEVERQADALGLHALRADALITVARLRDDAGDFPGAEEGFFEALLLAQTHRQDALVADASIGLMSVVGGRLFRFAEGHRWEELARASIARVGFSGQAQEARLLNNAGGVALSEHSFDVARELLEKALAIQERLRGPEHIFVADTLHNLATTCARIGRRTEAAAYATRTLAIRERLLGSEHRDVAASLDLLGRIAVESGRLEEGLVHCTRAVALSGRALPQDHPNRSIFLMNLGVAKTSVGDLAGGQEAFESTAAIQRKRLGPKHPSVGDTLENLAWVAILKGDYRRAIELGKEVAHAFPSRRAGALARIGEANRRAGRLEEARRQLEEALQLLLTNPDAGTEVHVLTQLAECELSCGLKEKARARLERGLGLGQRAHLPPQDLAQTRFALALALPLADGERASALAREAREWFEKSHREEDARRVDALLAGAARVRP
jgi:serine/threonine protein kinase